MTTPGVPGEWSSYLLSGGSLARGGLLDGPCQRPPVLLGELLRLGGRRPRRSHEDRRPVVAQLLDALLDVSQRAVVPVLGGGVEVRAGVPPPGELLDGRDVDDAVVEEGLQLRHVASDE